MRLRERDMLYPQQLWDEAHSSLHIGNGAIPLDTLMRMVKYNLDETIKVGRLIRDVSTGSSFKGECDWLVSMGDEMVTRVQSVIDYLSRTERGYLEAQARLEALFNEQFNSK